jgi:hypothetical protein
MPDRLPSLIVLVAFWVPPALAGWMAAGSPLRSSARGRVTPTHVALGAFVLLYSAGWYLLNLGAMPPYIPGATPDPGFGPPPPQAVAGLTTLTLALILPGSAIACAVAIRLRRAFERPVASHASA